MSMAGVCVEPSRLASPSSPHDEDKANDDDDDDT